MRRIFLLCLIVLFLLCALLIVLSQGTAVDHVRYGVTFSSQYAREIGVEWRDVYREMFEDLDVRTVRIPAYWPVIEPQKGIWMWDELDYQIREASLHGASVILVVGRRLPRWPECHVPEWAANLTWEEQKREIRELIRAVVERYKDDPAVVLWQVENEPYLPVFAERTCGPLDEDFFHEEVALVRELDPSSGNTRPILITDSGNLGTWKDAYRAGDVFGTSVYLYIWRADTGLFRTILPPTYYWVKLNLMRLFFGDKPTILSELSLEPWLGAAIEDVPLEEQLSRMSIDSFWEVIAYGKDTPFTVQYLWGVEWWYYMKEKGYPEFWNAAREIFRIQ